MKASELVELINSKIEEHGDLDVFTDRPDSLSIADVKEVNLDRYADFTDGEYVAGFVIQ